MPVDLTHPERGPAEMSGAELKTIRNRLGLSAIQLGRAFGYVGGDNTVSVTIRRYESDERPLPPWLARLAVMFDRHGVPPEWIEGAPAPRKRGRKPKQMPEYFVIARRFRLHDDGRWKTTGKKEVWEHRGTDRAAAMKFVDEHNVEDEGIWISLDHESIGMKRPGIPGVVWKEVKENSEERNV